MPSPGLSQPRRPLKVKSLDCEYISAILTMDAGLIGSIRCGCARAGLSTHLHAHIRGCAESHPTSRSHLLHAADRRDTRFIPARLVQDRHTVQRSPAPWPLDELHHTCPRLREPQRERIRRNRICMVTSKSRRFHRMYQNFLVSITVRSQQSWHSLMLSSNTPTGI